VLCLIFQMAVPMAVPCSPLPVKRTASPSTDPLSPQKTMRCTRRNRDEKVIVGSASNVDSQKLPLLSVSEQKAIQSAQVKRASQALRAAQGHLQKMRASLKSNAKRHADCKREVCRHQTVDEESRRLLVEEAWLSEGSHSHVAAARKLARYLEKIGADASLVVNVPQVVLKSRSDRTSFDRTVVDSAMFLMQHHRGVLDAALMQHAARQDKLEAAVAKQHGMVEAACSECDADAKRVSLTPPAKQGRRSMDASCLPSAGPDRQNACNA